MESRHVPGTSISLSVLSFSLPGRGPGDPTADAPFILALLKRATSHGIRTIEGVEWEPIEELPRYLLSALPAPDRPAFVLGLNPTDLRKEAVALSPEWLERVVPVLDASILESASDPSVGKVVTASIDRLSVPAWGVRATTVEQALRVLPRAIELGARLIAVPMSLLSARGAHTLSDQVSNHPVGILAMDPYANGALNGGLLAEPFGRAPTFDGPIGVREVAQRFAPVARLGFLTEGHRRTLPQAAVRFLQDLPGVVSVACRFRDPREIDAMDRIPDVPRLSPNEERRVYGASSGP
ncbi:MAG TPA: hypothetical protein VGV64_04980 [Thermoplasmata archaeon]|nr:hypothetical protein [Thermoplasmata archaeon]